MSQRTRQAGLEKSIQQVDAESRALAPQIARVNQLAQERAELDLRMGIISKLEKGVPRAFGSWMSWLGAFQTTSG
jgi:hypothetical protein